MFHNTLFLFCYFPLHCVVFLVFYRSSFSCCVLYVPFTFHGSDSFPCRSPLLQLAILCPFFAVVHLSLSNPEADIGAYLQAVCVSAHTSRFLRCACRRIPFSLNVTLYTTSCVCCAECKHGFISRTTAPYGTLRGEQYSSLLGLWNELRLRPAVNPLTQWRRFEFCTCCR